MALSTEDVVKAATSTVGELSLASSSQDSSFVDWLRKGSEHGVKLRGDVIEALEKSDDSSELKAMDESALKAHFGQTHCFDVLSTKRLVKYALKWQSAVRRSDERTLHSGVSVAYLSKAEMSANNVLAKEYGAVSQLIATIEAVLRPSTAVVPNSADATVCVDSTEKSADVLRAVDSFEVSTTVLTDASIAEASESPIDTHATVTLDSVFAAAITHLQLSFDADIICGLKHKCESLLESLSSMCAAKEKSLRQQLDSLKQHCDALVSCKNQCDEMFWNATVSAAIRQSKVVQMCSDCLSQVADSDTRVLRCAPRVAVPSLVPISALNECFNLRVAKGEKPQKPRIVSQSQTDALWADDFEDGDESEEEEKRHCSSDQLEMALNWMVSNDDLVTDCFVEFSLANTSMPDDSISKMRAKEYWMDAFGYGSSHVADGSSDDDRDASAVHWIPFVTGGIPLADVIADISASKKRQMEAVSSKLCSFKVASHKVVAGYCYRFRVAVQNEAGLSEWSDAFEMAAPKLALEFDKDAISAASGGRKHIRRGKKDKRCRVSMAPGSSGKIGWATIPVTHIIKRKHHSRFCVEFTIREMHDRGVHIGFVDASDKRVLESFQFHGNVLGRMSSFALHLRSSNGLKFRIRSGGSKVLNVVTKTPALRGDRVMLDVNFRKRRLTVWHNDDKLPTTFPLPAKAVLFAVCSTPQHGKTEVEIRHVPSALPKKKRLKLLRKLSGGHFFADKKKKRKDDSESEESSDESSSSSSSSSTEVVAQSKSALLKTKKHAFDLNFSGVRGGKGRGRGRKSGRSGGHRAPKLKMKSKKKKKRP